LSVEWVTTILSGSTPIVLQTIADAFHDHAPTTGAEERKPERQMSIEDRQSADFLAKPRHSSKSRQGSGKKLPA
jgi:hypothetical protein